MTGMQEQLAASDKSVDQERQQTQPPDFFAGQEKALDLEQEEELYRET